MLFRISDYAHLYKISKTWLWVFKTKPIIHRSLLFSSVEKKTDIPLEELLQGDKMQEYVNRPNYEGQFAIHLSADMKDAKSTLLLMKAGAKQYRNKKDDLPALENVIGSMKTNTEDDADVISNIAAIIIVEACEEATFQERAFQQLTSQNNQGQSLLSVLKPDQFKKVALWNKEKTLNFTHLMNEESISWLTQQTEGGEWKKKDDIFEALKENNKITDALALLKEIKKDFDNCDPSQLVDRISDRSLEKP